MPLLAGLNMTFEIIPVGFTGGSWKALFQHFHHSAPSKLATWLACTGSAGSHCGHARVGQSVILAPLSAAKAWTPPPVFNWSMGTFVRKILFLHDRSWLTVWGRAVGFNAEFLDPWFYSLCDSSIQGLACSVHYSTVISLSQHDELLHGNSRAEPRTKIVITYMPLCTQKIKKE